MGTPREHYRQSAIARAKESARTIIADREATQAITQEHLATLAGQQPTGEGAPNG